MEKGIMQQASGISEKNLKKKPSDKKPAHITNAQSLTPEVGGRDGLEPTRYGDWEHKGKCVDF